MVRIAELWLDFIQDPEGSDLNIAPNDENKERWIKFAESIIASDGGALKFAVVGEDVGGSVLYSWEDSPLQLQKKRGTIYDLFVKKSSRGRGIGKALLLNAMKDLRNHNVEIIQLTVKSDNFVAIRLYESLGFKEVLKIMRKEV